MPTTDIEHKPYGVSGIIRCYNCESTVSACIDSCVTAVNELLLIYQDSSDSTFDIIKDKTHKYPGKIRLIPYPHFVFPLDLTEEQFKSAYNQPEGSPHLFSNLTNYGIEQCRFSHFILLDSDQIYFTAKLLSFCNAYRSTIKTEISEIDRENALAYFKPHNKNISVNRQRWNTHINHLLKLITNEKISVALSGINIYGFLNNWYICTGDESNPTIFGPFNGVKDIFFGRTDERCKMMISGKNKSGLIHYIEYFPNKQDIPYAGFFWFHLKPTLTTTKYQFYKYFKDNRYKFYRYNIVKDGFTKLGINLSLRPKELILSTIYECECSTLPWKLLTSPTIKINKSTPTTTNDFIMEYNDTFCDTLNEWINHHRDNCNYCLGGISIEKSLKLYIYYKLFHDIRENYINARKSGQEYKLARKIIVHRFESILSTQAKGKHTTPYILNKHPWIAQLREFRNITLIYVHTERQWIYIQNIISSISSRVIIITNFNPDLITSRFKKIIVIPLTIDYCYFNDGSWIYMHFPSFYSTASSLRLLLHALMPSKILIIEGCHVESHIIGEIARNLSIKTVLLQFGWPGVKRIGFFDIPFNIIICWGNVFSKILKEWNPNSYTFPLGNITNGNSTRKTSLSFFLQGPYYIADYHIIEKILNSIVKCAKALPNTIIYVKSHPEYNLTPNITSITHKYPNIIDVSDRDTSEVLSQSLIAIAQYSSILVEAPLFKAIPISYNPVLKSIYIPDIETMGIGFCVSSDEDLITTIRYCLKCYNNMINNSKLHYKSLYTNTGNKSIENIATFINNL